MVKIKRGRDSRGGRRLRVKVAGEEKKRRRRTEDKVWQKRGGQIWRIRECVQQQDKWWESVKEKIDGAFRKELGIQ